MLRAPIGTTKKSRPCCNPRMRWRARFSRQIPTALHISCSRALTSKQSDLERHGFVRLSPCFSRSLAPVSAESRHEAKSFFISRIHLRRPVMQSQQEGRKNDSPHTGCASSPSQSACGYFEQNDDFKSDHCVAMISGAERMPRDAPSRKFGKPGGAHRWRSIPGMLISAARAATRIRGAERWLNHAPTPVDLHHSSFAVAIHPFDHLRG